MEGQLDLYPLEDTSRGGWFDEEGRELGGGQECVTRVCRWVWIPPQAHRAGGQEEGKKAEGEERERASEGGTYPGQVVQECR